MIQGRSHGWELTLTITAVGVFGGSTLCMAQLAPPVWSNPPAVAVPGVEHRTFHSSTLDTAVGYNILLPPGYDSADRRYPVIYWLHGVGGDENAAVSAVAPPLVAAMNDRALPPFIVVFVNGADYTFFADSPDGAIPAETAFISELIPHIDATFRTVADRRSRGIEGFSMGGFSALAHAMKHVDLFGSVVAYAPALLEVQETSGGASTLGRAGGTHEGGSPLPAELVTKNPRIFEMMFGGDPAVFARHSPWVLLPDNAARLRAELPIRIVIGTADGLWNANQLFHELMLEHGYDHEFEVIPDVAHTLDVLYRAVGTEGARLHVRAGAWR
jgi:S-formylglutathione hydrolase FrmB